MIIKKQNIKEQNSLIFVIEKKLKLTSSIVKVFIYLDNSSS